ncbi:MAG: hypothetical protein EWM47_07130 [Anaerolineaceae bacterium]|nr:MAG: hypothetical protein EWM47_07130 [Anaerolineaceae bacterium]
MNNIDTIIKKKSEENTIEYGYYYLPSEVCKNIIITAGLSGVHSAFAVKRIRSNIRHKKGEVSDFIPALRSMDQDIISYYAGELAESLVNAAGNGKGVEIAIGYPKILVISVN